VDFTTDAKLRWSVRIGTTAQRKLRDERRQLTRKLFRAAGAILVDALKQSRLA